jgi:glycosyltransferase involved in cell wall biosynthesis
MRVLQVVKTTDGAAWATWQAAVLRRIGIDVHVALPATSGLTYDDWVTAGATVHVAALDFPMKAPWRIAEVFDATRRLIDRVQPDIIHSHFVGTTLTLRRALGKDHTIPRVYQVAGPLHLEHSIYRAADIGSAGANDYWICSSRCIWSLLEQHGVDSSRLFLSYYGWDLADSARERTNVLRETLGIRPDELVVGNISWLYAPKYHLGQRTGLKCHEHMIEALGSVVRRHAGVVGVLAGGAWGGATWYEDRLRRQALATGNGRIKMPGHLPSSVVRRAWPDFDCAIHVPLSENCGGVIEPLYAGVPTIASRVGGLPEVVIDDVTGKLVPSRSPRALAAAILQVLGNLPHYRALALRGHELVKTMFNIERTAVEVAGIYNYVLGRSTTRPDRFDSQTAVASSSETAEQLS